MRLINADALIDDIEKSTFNRTIKEFFEDFVEDTPTVEAKPVGWIPCSERLPEVEGEYLTCDKKGNIHTMYHFQSNKHPFAIGDNHPRYYPVIAWMPLPEPYREDEES